MLKSISSENIQITFLYLLAFCFFILILPEHVFRGDMNFWVSWTQRIHDHGLGHIYNLRTEYHPFFLYCLWLFQWIMGTMEEVEAHLNYVKVFPLIFDFIGALSVFFVLKKERNAIIYPLFLLFNIGYMYNTMLWGQVDSIHSAFALLSIIFTFKNRIIIATVFYLLALNMKLQAIIYLPIMALIWLPYFLKSYKITLKTIGVLAFCQLIILIPFILADSLPGLWKVIVGAEGRHPHVSMNAYNLWYFFLDTSPAKVLDKNIFAFGTSYKTWGRALFFLFSAIALFPLLRKSYLSIKTQTINKDAFQEAAFLTAALITIIFFYFNTQMHERYSHTAILLFFFYAVKSKKYFLYVLCSFAYLLNMEDVLKVFKLSNYGILFLHPIFISSLFLIVIMISLYYLYSPRLRK